MSIKRIIALSLVVLVSQVARADEEATVEVRPVVSQVRLGNRAEGLTNQFNRLAEQAENYLNQAADASQEEYNNFVAKAKATMKQLKEKLNQLKDEVNIAVQEHGQAAANVLEDVAAQAQEELSKLKAKAQRFMGSLSAE